MYEEQTVQKKAETILLHQWRTQEFCSGGGVFNKFS